MRGSSIIQLKEVKSAPTISQLLDYMKHLTSDEDINKNILIGLALVLTTLFIYLFVRKKNEYV